MKQLKMCFLLKEATPVPLPEGYAVKNYENESEKNKYLPCYEGAESEKEAIEWFNRRIKGYRDCNPAEDTFFILYGEEYVAAITAILHKNKEGYVHMVGVRADFRGKGLSHALNYIALKKLCEQGAKRIILTTDDERTAAVKSYLRAGFLPMVNGLLPKDKRDAVARWTKLLKQFGYKEYELLTHFGKKITIKI